MTKILDESKPLVKLTSNSTCLSDAEKNMLQSDNISVTIRNGIRTVEGYNNSGEKVVIETILSNNDATKNNGFRQQNMSVCDKLNTDERRKVAKDLRDTQKLTQLEIAKKLGVSQKTISNDLSDV